MSEEIEIPDTVVDKDAYIEYLKYSKMDALKSGKRLIQTSDIHISIDPFWNQSTVEKNLSNLPFNEKEEIMKRVKISRMLQDKMLILRAKAFGKELSINNPIAMSKAQTRLILDERHAEILEYYGRYLDDNEILKILQLDWGYNISINSLKRFKEKNKAKIASLQEGFRKDLNASKLYHKRYRLEEIWYLYKQRKLSYETTKSREDVRLMMALIKQAKDESEAHQLHISGEITHKVEVTIAHHIEREIMNNLTIQDIIIARVSSRLKVNPAYIINRLHNSIYAKFTGFASPDDSLLEDEIVYPSTMVYDWKKIREKHTKEDADKKYAEFEEIKEEERSFLSDIKKELQQRLQEKQQAVNVIKNRIDKNTAD
jgi:hypothetical protein